ncbi:hypothetical protein HDV00_001197, partial [Rhizophlyctis rosea]
ILQQGFPGKKASHSAAVTRTSLTQEEKDHLIATRGCFYCRKENAGHVVSNCPEREEAEEGSSAAAVTNGNEASDSDEDNANYNSDDNVVGAISERIQRNFNSDSDDSDDDFVSAISRAFSEEPFVVAVAKARPAERDFILTAHLKKHPLNVLIDTGSASSLVSREFIKKFRVRYHKLHKPCSYTQASKGAFETTAYVKGRIDTNYGNFGPFELEIADLNRNFDAIIRRNSILQHSAIIFKYLSSRGVTARTKKELTPTQKPSTKKGNAGDGKVTSVGHSLPLSSVKLKKKVVARVDELKEALEYEGELWDLAEFVGAIEEEKEQETNGLVRQVEQKEVFETNKMLFPQYSSWFSDVLPDFIPPEIKDTIYHEIKILDPSKLHKSSYYAIPLKLSAARQIVENNVRSGQWIPCTTFTFREAPPRVSKTCTSPLRASSGIPSAMFASSTPEPVTLA